MIQDSIDRPWDRRELNIGRYEYRLPTFVLKAPATDFAFLRAAGQLSDIVLISHVSEACSEMWASKRADREIAQPQVRELVPAPRPGTAPS